jgi:beta-mannosidase
MTGFASREHRKARTVWVMDLSGEWKAAPADDELRRTAFALDFNHDSWEPVAVPGHWQNVPAFADSDGPVIYRTRFDWDAGPEGARSWVVLDGLFYQGDVWFDGGYLGDPEGYFVPHSYEITDLARLSNHHALAVEVTCSPQRNKAAKRNLTGVFQHADHLDPEVNPGGIWRPVHIERTGPVRIDRLTVLCREADAGRANLAVRAIFDSDRARTVTIRTTLGDRIERTMTRPLATGANEVEWTFGVDEPELWWPWSLGAQPFAQLRVEVSTDDSLSHARELRTALRQVSMRDFIMSVNGERLFLKGVDLAPTGQLLATASADDVRRDVEIAREAGLDLVRVHGHIARPELYDAADELGMLVWQDLPLHRGYARSVRRQAVRQAREAVWLLGHHPSIALWCGHNAPVSVDVEPGRTGNPARVKARFYAAQGLPTWNKTVLDGWIKNALRQADDSRPVVAHSGIVPHPPQFDGTDSHLYFGWYRGDERDLPAFAATVPRMVRFVSEFGAQSVPNSAEFIDATAWPDLDWESLERRHGMQKTIFDMHVPPEAYGTFSAWREATQDYQATVIKHQVEALRRLKNRPTGGFAVFFLADSHPAISWSLLDHNRVAKPAYQALIDACRPVIVVADRFDQHLVPGQSVAIDVHTVSDLRIDLDNVETTAHLMYPGGESRWQWRGQVTADECAFIGSVAFIVPDEPGQVTLDLTLVADDRIVTNRYATTIRRV